MEEGERGETAESQIVSKRGRGARKIFFSFFLFGRFGKKEKRFPLFFFEGRGYVFLIQPPQGSKRKDPQAKAGDKPRHHDERSRPCRRVPRVSDDPE